MSQRNNGYLSTWVFGSPWQKSVYSSTWLTAQICRSEISFEKSSGKRPSGLRSPRPLRSHGVGLGGREKNNNNRFEVAAYARAEVM